MTTAQQWAETHDVELRLCGTSPCMEGDACIRRWSPNNVDAEAVRLGG